MRPYERLQCGLNAAEALAADLEKRSKKIRETIAQVDAEIHPGSDVIEPLVWININRMVLNEMERLPSTVHFVEHMIAGAQDR